MKSFFAVLLSMVTVSLFSQSTYDFSLVFSSDTQFGKFYTSEPDDQYDSIEEIVTNGVSYGVGNNFIGVVMNGDVTNNGEANEWSKFNYWKDIRMETNLSLNSWFGLGNHDYVHPMYDGDSAALNRSIENFIDHIEEIDAEGDLFDSDYSKAGTSYSGSFSYAWDIEGNENNWRFIQLNYYPSFDKTYEGGGYNYNFTESLDFLEDVLNSSSGYKVIINTHQDIISQNVINILANYSNVVAINAGHYHSRTGLTSKWNPYVPTTDEFFLQYPPTTIDIGSYEIPVFYGGSIDNNNYSVIEFFDNKIVVKGINSSNGSVEVLDDHTINFSDMSIDDDSYKVRIFKHADWEGTDHSFYETTNISNMSAELGTTWDASLSSLKVNPGYKVTLYSETNYGGNSWTYSHNNAYVASHDTAKSLKVETTDIPVVTLYEHGDYKGKEISFSGTVSISQLSLYDLNDQLTAIKLVPGYQVTLYEHAYYGGESWTYQIDTGLITLNDKASSLIIEACDPPVIAVYEDQYFKGRQLNFSGEIEITNLKDFNMNDLISSIQIIDHNYEIEVFKHSNFGGNSKTYTGNVLYVSAWDDFISPLEINDISSIKVRLRDTAQF